MNNDPIKQSSRVAACIYCGHGIPVDPNDVEASYAVLREHDVHCIENPLVNRIAQQQERLDRYDALLHSRTVEVWRELPDEDKAACDDGYVDIFFIGEPERPRRYDDGGWYPVDDHEVSL